MSNSQKPEQTINCSSHNLILDLVELNTIFESTFYCVLLCAGLLNSGKLCSTACQLAKNL